MRVHIDESAARRHSPRSGFQPRRKLGTALGFGVVLLLANQAVGGAIDLVQPVLEAPAIAIGLAFGMVWIPII